MIDSTPTVSGAAVDERPAEPPQPVVEADAGCEAEEASEDALAQTGQSARPVTLQREQVQKIDSMRWRMGARWGPRAGLVPSRRSHHDDVELGG